MNPSETESAVFSRLSPKQREDINQFPPAMRKRTLSILSRKSSDKWSYEIALTKMVSCVSSISDTGKTPDWNVGYMEASRRHQIAKETAMLPPLPESMQLARDIAYTKEREAFAEMIAAQSDFKVTTSNLNGRGGFGD